MTTYFVGNHYEVTDNNGVITITKYYFAGTQRIAMRKNGILTYMLSDHLGSTSLTTSDTGVVLSELRYTAWGEVRYQAGTTPTGYTYTGQYSNTADFGLMFYNARWYDPSLGRFAQADSIVPGGVQGYDRYAYVNNSPLNYVDPSGHNPCQGAASGYQCNRELDRAAAAEAEARQKSIKDIFNKFLSQAESHCEGYAGDRLCSWELVWVPKDFPGATGIFSDFLRKCLKTSENRGSRANLQDDQIQANLPD